MSTQRALSDVTKGQELGSIQVQVDRARLVQYAAASGDRNPIHWNEAFATSVGLPNVIAHGMFTMGAAVELVADWAGGAQHVRSYGTRFTKPVVVPAEGQAVITVSGKVTAVDDEAATCTVTLTAVCDDVQVLGRARATVALAS